ncbi:alpha beta-hydrolases superfamily protein [Klebsormidium nitens]|uniref:protein-S-isoprenylcysteine alpha-carbonyl methylesterase n=1 Tax=Klebsormidium nitens TaxID=105231 RepID=A0A1Y1I942_KLENI|nr:alpha beta-hydrolases superfamily protein [Klebsormidium nitens]|eukprot:GAQ87063.1 alpha beta-hydrolases superfamily protein [Klebsormidium nitens]
MTTMAAQQESTLVHRKLPPSNLSIPDVLADSPRRMHTPSPLGRRRSGCLAVGPGEASSEVERQGVTNAAAALIGPRRSLLENLHHSYRESVEVLGFTITLLRALGFGYKWIIKAWSLVVFAILLMPGFLQVVWFYYTSPQVYRSLVYGTKARNRLDLYMPPGHLQRPRPVVVFVTGGAWVIGYKAWGALLGRRLANRGVLVACLDYRNFPQGSVSDMVADISTGIEWVLLNIGEFGGDPGRVYVVGQSAGAHLTALALLRQAIKEAELEERSANGPKHVRFRDAAPAKLEDRFGPPDPSQATAPENPTLSTSSHTSSEPPANSNGNASNGEQAKASPRNGVMKTAPNGPQERGGRELDWYASQLRAYIGVSGAYDIEDMLEHWHHRGLYKTIMLTLMEGRHCLPGYSPTVLARKAFTDKRRDAGPLLPPITLLHGTADRSIPHHASLMFAAALREAGAAATVKLYQGKTHTDPIIEDPMRGGSDPMVEDILAVMKADNLDFRKEPVPSLPKERMLPELLIELATAASPF